MIYAAIFMLSFSSLAFEILLTRIFSISQWNHLSFMVISIALFGFACSGTCLSLLKTKGLKWEDTLSKPGQISTFLAVYSLSTLCSLIVLNCIPLDYFRLPVEPIQTIYIFITYLMLAFPFFICGIVFAIAYASVPEKTGIIYFFSMAGSATGAVTPVLLLPITGEGWLTVITGVSPLVLIPFYVKYYGSKRIRQPQLFPPGSEKLFFIFLVCLGCIVLVLTTGTTKEVFKISPSSYKALSQILKFPETRIENTHLDIRGRVDTVTSKYLRYAPGLSIKYTELLPDQRAAYTDGDTPFFFYDPAQNIPSRFSNFTFSHFTLDWVGYHMQPEPASALVLLKGGGMAIPCAVGSGAKDVTLVHENPNVARQIEKTYAIKVISENPRSYLAGCNRKFDIIHMDNRGASLPGASALEQDYSFTTEAFSAYLSHLNKNGRLIITRRLLLPPSDSIRMWATAYESLKKSGIKNPDHHIAILRNWDNYVLIVSPSALTQGPELERFADKMNFDIVRIPKLKPNDNIGKANQYNIFDIPYYYHEINKLAAAYTSGTESDYFTGSLSCASPQKENTPFPYKHLKWRKLKEAYKTTGSRPYTLFLSGEIVVVVVFIEALLISFMLLIIPVIVISKQTKGNTNFLKLSYFFWVGAGFMFVELFFIKQYILLFGSPVLSVTIALAGILLTSGLGGILSQEIHKRCIRNLVLLLIGVLCLYWLNGDKMWHALLGYSKNLRFFFGIAGLIIPGILMGFPFTLGMRWLTRNARERAYAWAANGCASVLTAILSAHIALNLGISVILFFAIIAYALAYISVAGKKGLFP